MLGNDTIYAYSSGEGVAAIGVLRISGPECMDVIKAVVRKPLEERKAQFVGLYAPGSAEIIDRGIAIFFRGPHSSTGEDCLELHTHGSVAVRRRLYSALAEVDGCRVATPGEFTKRAFLNGKMDLPAVEALGDLLDARTERQRVQAVGALDGVLRKTSVRWREEIIKCLGLIEACLDFSDEGDAPSEYYAEIANRSAALLEEMQRAIDSSRAAEVIRSGFKVAICGKPNAGKSSLLNWFAKRDVAIVAEVAGTTRDVIEVSLDLDGWLVLMSDTAGLRVSDDPVEEIGVGRAKKTGLESNLILWLWEAGGSPEVDVDFEQAGVEFLSVQTKADLIREERSGIESGLSVSVKSGVGLDRLRDEIVCRLGLVKGFTEDVVLIGERQRQAVDGAIIALGRVAKSEREFPPELLAEELRLAAFHVGSLTGTVGVEEILGEIFGRFCMGK